MKQRKKTRDLAEDFPEWGLDTGFAEYVAEFTAVEKRLAQEAEAATPLGFTLLSLAIQYRTFVEKHLVDSTDLTWNELRIVALLEIAQMRITHHDLKGVQPDPLASAGISQQQLAKEIGLNKATIVHVVDRLEHLGVVFRAPDPEDRRVNFVMLSREGRKRGQAFLAKLRELESSSIFAALSAEERDTLLALLKKILRARMSRRSAAKMK